MHVLICDFDLFHEVGGGQTVYGGLVRRLTDHTFYYFRRSERSNAARPANAVAIPLRQRYEVPSTPGLAGPFLESFADCMGLAASVAQWGGRRTFDVLDTPDYRQAGLFLAQTLAFHDVHVERVALALHGGLSSALTTAWPWSGDAGRMFAGLHLRERLQMRAADVRYALSPFYARELNRRAELPVNLFDPLTVLRQTEPTLAPSGGAPDLAFIGRKERRKGPDLAIDLAWWTGRRAYGQLRLIGPDGVNHQGRGSAEILQRAAAIRGLTFTDEPAMSQAGLQALCRSRTIVLAPSRYDQFNLVALEALMEGCPVIVGRNSGVAEWIITHLPGWRDSVISFECDRGGAAGLADMCRNYDVVRTRLVEDVATHVGKPDEDSLRRIYDGESSSDQRVARWLNDLGRRYFIAGGPWPTVDWRMNGSHDDAVGPPDSGMTPPVGGAPAL